MVVHSLVFAVNDGPHRVLKTTISQVISITNRNVNYLELSFNCEDILNDQGLNIKLTSYENNI